MSFIRPRTPPASTTPDQEMADNVFSQPSSLTSSPRVLLPSALSSFSLPHSTTPPSPSGSSMTLDDPFPLPINPLTPTYPMHRKLRRSSLLSLRGTAKPEINGGYSRRSASPVSVFPSWRERAGSPLSSLPSVHDHKRKAMNEDTSGVSNLLIDYPGAIPTTPGTSTPKTRPSTPPPRSNPSCLLDSPATALSASFFDPEYRPLPKRNSLKPPRLLSLLSEAPPQESELTSEASFQRFIASHAELPVPFYPRTPRNARGRFPEEVGGDDDDEDGGDMSDDDDDFASVIGTSGLGGGESIADDTAWMVGSPAGPGIMDVEMGSGSYGSPSISALGGFMSTGSTPTGSVNGSINGQQWRDPPPTTSGASAAGRIAKRKFTSEDRYDPYPSSKRRAVSPSVSTLGTSSPHLSHNHYTHSHTSSPSIPHHVSPILIPRSPISLSAYPRSGQSSPIIRPLPRLYANGNGSGDREREREVRGAGDVLGSIDLGS